MTIGSPDQPFQPHSPYGGSNPMGNMLMSMLSNFMSGQFGMMPTGFQGGNLHDTARQIELTEQQRQAVQAAGRADIPMVMDTIRGGYQITGQAWTPEAQQAARSAAETGVNWASLGSPQMLDTISGGRSAAAMATQMFSGGRRALDPVYGDIGLSANSAAAMTRDVHGYFYGDRLDESGSPIAGTGASEWRRRTKGVTSNEMGQMYSRLTREGMMSTISPMTRGESRSFEASSPEEQESTMAGRRSQAAQKTAKKLEEWTGSIAALKDIFGPDKSFDQLMKHMEDMTGGAYNQMRGRDVEMSMRNLVSSGRLAGVGPGEISQRVVGMSDQLQRTRGITGGGINSIFASQFVTSGLNFTTGYGTSGAGAVNSWGLYNQDRQVQEHTSNVVAASQSRMANRMGATARLADRLGTGAFRGDAKKLVKAIQRGQIPEQYADMSQGEFVSFLSENSDLSKQEIQSAFQATHANQEAVHKYNLGESVQRLQRVEMRDKFMTPALQSSARVSVRSAIGSGKGSSELGTGIGGVMAGSISDMDPATLADADARNAAIADDVEKYLKAQAKKDTPRGKAAAKYLAKLDGMGRKGKQRALILLAEQGYTSMESSLQRRGVIKPGESYVNFGIRNSDEVRSATDTASDTAALDAAGASNAAGLIGDTPLQRGMEHLQQGGQGGMPGMAAAVAGLADRRMVAGVLGTNLNMLDAALEREQGAENPNEERIRAIENQRAETLQIAENYGLTNEKGEFDPTAGREDGGEVEFDPNFTFQGATINLNGTEIMTDAEGGVERTGVNQGAAG